MEPDLSNSEFLDDIAAQIAEGNAVDWAQSIRTHKHLEASLQRLKLIEAFAMVHSTPVPEEELHSELPTLDSNSNAPTPGVQPALVAPSTWGRLEVGELIGAGGFADVYRAHDPRLQKDVALKLLRQDRNSNGVGAERFLKEARCHAKVDHKNVVTIHGVDEHEGRVGLWTALIEGRTLEACVREGKSRGDKHAAVIGAQLCLAVSAVHSAGLVHRDIKTSNIMIREDDDHAVLMDFGSAVEKRPWSELFRDDPVAGTPLFTAPEVLRGGESGIAADIYSLGVVLYRIASGRFPVEAETLHELNEKHSGKKPTPLKEHKQTLDDQFVKIVERALSFDPATRYYSALEMETDLCGYLGTRLPTRKVDQEPSLPRAVPIAVAVASAAALIIAFWFLYPTWNPPVQVSAELMRLAGGKGEVLLDGSPTYPGDKMFINLKGSENLHIYALNVDTTGALNALYPSTVAGAENPLAADQLHQLPGVFRGRSNYWELDDTKGPEAFLLIASTSPLPQASALVRKGREIPRDIAANRKAPGSSPVMESDLGPSAGIGKPDLPRGVERVVFEDPADLLPSDESARELWQQILSMADEDPAVWAKLFWVRNQAE
jgi:serine/threonine protein kinase